MHVELSLWDTAGQEEFDRLRSLSYDDTHAIMLCFSVSRIPSFVPSFYLDTAVQVDSPESLENVEAKWVGEIADNCPGVRLVLVALKCDLRETSAEEEEAAAVAGAEGRPSEPKRAPIEYKQGLAMAEKIRALRYLGECCEIDRMWWMVSLTKRQNAPR